MRKSLRSMLWCIRIDRVWEKVGDAEIAIGSCFSILTQNLGLQGVSAKHVSQLLTVEPKGNWMNLHRLFTARWRGWEFQKLFITDVSLQVRCQIEAAVFSVEDKIIPKTGKSGTAVQMWREFSLFSLAVVVLWTVSLFLEVEQWVESYLTVLQCTGEAVQKLMTGT